LQWYPFSRGRFTLTKREQQKSGKPHFERVQRNRLQLAAGLPQPPTQESYYARCNSRPRRPQLTKCVPFQHIGSNIRERSGIRRSEAAIECSNLAEKVSCSRVPKAQLSPLFAHDGESDPTLDNQVKMSPGISAREQHGAFLKSKRPEGGGANCKLIGRQTAEQIRPQQKRNQVAVIGHVVA